MAESEISQNSIIRWSTEAVATEVNDEVILMNLERDRCYGLGNTGSDIWRRLKDPIQVSTLLTQLWEVYDSVPGEIESDVLRTLNQFAAEGLIHDIELIAAIVLESDRFAHQLREALEVRIAHGLRGDLAVLARFLPVIEHHADAQALQGADRLLDVGERAVHLEIARALLRIR